MTGVPSRAVMTVLLIVVVVLGIAAGYWVFAALT